MAELTDRQDSVVGPLSEGPCAHCGTDNDTCSRLCAAGGTNCCETCRATAGCTHTKPEGVGTGAGEGAPRQDTASAWVTRSTDCPEAPAQAHPLVGRLSEAEKDALRGASCGNCGERSAVLQLVARIVADREPKLSRFPVDEEFAATVACLLAGRMDGQQAVATLTAIHERIVREHTGRALAEQRIKDQLGVTSRALPIVRAARQEQGR